MHAGICLVGLRTELKASNTPTRTASDEARKFYRGLWVMALPVDGFPMPVGGITDQHSFQRQTCAWRAASGQYTSTLMTVH